MFPGESFFGAVRLSHPCPSEIRIGADAGHPSNHFRSRGDDNGRLALRPGHLDRGRLTAGCDPNRSFAATYGNRQGCDKRQHMIQTQLRLPENGVLEAVLPRLKGRAFHVTLRTTLDFILRSEEIRPNQVGSYNSPFGSSNSYFRKRDCVSLFDYRSLTPEQLDESLLKCSPTQPLHDPSNIPGIAIFLLSPKRCPELLPWTEWKQEQAWGEQVVPYAEAGYPGPISLKLVDEVICVEVDRDPNSLALRIWKAREQTETPE